MTDISATAVETFAPSPDLLSFTSILRTIGRTDKETLHGYGQHYDRWLAPYRDKPVRLLEIGIAQFGGGSVLAFAEYFPRGEIWGLDIAADMLPPDVAAHPRVKLVKADAYATLTAASLGYFNIIVDDCYHDAGHQGVAMELYSPWVKPGGMYIIEEAAPPYEFAVDTEYDLADNRATHDKTSVIVRLTRR